MQLESWVMQESEQMLNNKSCLWDWSWSWFSEKPWHCTDSSFRSFWSHEFISLFTVFLLHWFILFCLNSYQNLVRPFDWWGEMRYKKHEQSKYINRAKFFNESISNYSMIHTWSFPLALFFFALFCYWLFLVVFFFILFVWAYFFSSFSSKFFLFFGDFILFKSSFSFYSPSLSWYYLLFSSSAAVSI